MSDDEDPITASHRRLNAEWNAALARMSGMASAYKSSASFGAAAYFPQDLRELGIYDVKFPITGPTLPGIPGAVGDGVKDDTFAIQGHIDFASQTTGKGVVYFPPGVYLVSRALLIPSDITLLGNGIGRSVIIQSDIGRPVLKNQDTAAGNRNITVEQLTIDGGNAPFGKENLVATVVLERVDDGAFIRCEFRYSASNAMRMTTCSNMLFDRCVSHDNKHQGYYAESPARGVHRPSQFFRYVGCVAHDNGWDGFQVYSSNDFTYDGCLAWGNGNIPGVPFGRGGGGFSSESSVRVTFNGCISRNDQIGPGFGLWTSPFENSRSNEDILFSGCVAEGNKADGFFISAAEGVTISGCVARRNERRGIWIVTGADQLGRTLLATDVTVSACDVKENADHGILISAAERVLVTGCRVRRNGSVTSRKDGIRIENGYQLPNVFSRNVLVTSCLVGDPDNLLVPIQELAIRSLGDSDQVFAYANAFLNYFTGPLNQPPVQLVGKENVVQLAARTRADRPKAVLAFINAGQAHPGGLTRFYGTFMGQFANDVEIPVGFPCVVRNLAAQISATLGGSCTYTLWKNGNPTQVVATIAPGTDGGVSIPADTVSLVSGDRLSVQVDASPGTAVLHKISVELWPDE